MRPSLLALPALFLLSACAGEKISLNTDATASGATATHGSSASAATKPLEAYPLELTVEHFKNMTLSGTALTIGRILESNSVYTKRYVTYRSNGVKVSGTFSIPNAEGRHPLIVQNHGYIDPAVYTNGRGLRREQDALARAGFAVLHTDYRKHAESDPDPDTRNIYDAGLAYAMDSANAVLAVREANLPNVNAAKVGMLGHSMGGGVTLHILVAHPELVDAAVLYAPVHADAWMNFERWRMDGDDAGPTLAFLKTKQENPAAWEALSQASMLENIEDPILLFQGLQDKDVPAAWSNDLAVRLESLDKNARYITYPEDGHEFSTTWRHFMDTSIAFYREHLKQ